MRAVGALLLDTVLRLHVKFGRHLVAVVALEVGIEGLVVAGNGAPNARGVGGEDGTHFGAFVLQEEHAQPRHPFVGLVDDALAGEGVFHHNFGKPPCSIREHRGFVVVAVGVERVHLKQIPRAAVDFVFFGKERCKVHQYGHRIAGHVPSADAHLQSGCGCGLAPVGVQFRLLGEEGIVLVLSEVGTNENKMIVELFLQGLSTCRQHGVDAPYFIANFPAGLKDDIGKKSRMSLNHKRRYTICLLAKVINNKRTPNFSCSKPTYFAVYLRALQAPSYILPMSEEHAARHFSCFPEHCVCVLRASAFAFIGSLPETAEFSTW